MTEFAETVVFLGVFGTIWSVAPGFFATRALFTGTIYSSGGRMGGFGASGQWLGRTTSPIRYWCLVVFYYVLSLAGWLPLVLLLAGVLKMKAGTSAS